MDWVVGELHTRNVWHTLSTTPVNVHGVGA